MPGTMVTLQTANRFVPDIIENIIPGMLGGIRMPRKPEAAINAPE